MSPLSPYRLSLLGFYFFGFLPTLLVALIPLYFSVWLAGETEKWGRRSPAAGEGAGSSSSAHSIFPAAPSSTLLSGPPLCLQGLVLTLKADMPAHLQGPSLGAHLLLVWPWAEAALYPW